MMNIKQLKDIALEMKGRYGEQWQSALCESGDSGVNAKKYHAVISEQNDDLFIKTDDDSLENSWLCDYLEAVSPGNVLELIKRLAAAESKLAKQEPVEVRNRITNIALRSPLEVEDMYRHWFKGLGPVYRAAPRRQRRLL